MESNIKEIFDGLDKAAELKERLEDVTCDISERLNNLIDFVDNLVENITEDTLHIYNIKSLRKDLKVVDENLLLIFNNLDIETAISKDTMGTKVQ